MQRTSLTVWALTLFPAAAFVFPQSHLLVARRRLAPTFVGSLDGRPASGVGSSSSSTTSINDLVDDDAAAAEDELLGARGSSAAFTVAPHEAGLRLDVFLAARVVGQSRSYLSSLVAGSHVEDARTGRARTKKAGKVKSGETLAVTFALNDLFTIAAEDLPLDVIYEDENLIAVNKAVGMVVHPAPGNWNGTLVNALAHRFHAAQAAAVGWDAALRPGIVHRLDKGTSGVIVVAKTPEALAFLAAAFKERRVSKAYLAIAVGLPQPNEPRAGPSYTAPPIDLKAGAVAQAAAQAAAWAPPLPEAWADAGKLAEVWVDEPVGRHATHRQRMAVVAEGRSARSRVAPLAYNQKLSLCRVAIETGRTHQIRVHLAHLRHPVLGDELYGFKDWNERYAKPPQGLTRASTAATSGSVRERVVRPLLHAAELVLPLPLGSAPSTALQAGGRHSATVEPMPGGGWQLRLRCGVPSDFAGVARSIAGEDLGLDALLGPLPGSPGASPAAQGAATTLDRTSSSSSSGARRAADANGGSGPAEAGMLNLALLAAAEASDDGWYD